MVPKPAKAHGNPLLPAIPINGAGPGFRAGTGTALPSQLAVPYSVLTNLFTCQPNFTTQVTIKQHPCSVTYPENSVSLKLYATILG